MTNGTQCTGIASIDDVGTAAMGVQSYLKA